MRWITAILFFLLAACRHPVYLLKQEGRTQILTPPRSEPEVKRARSHPSLKTGCDVDSESFTVAWHRNTARLAVRAETYYAPAEGQQNQTTPVSIAESGPRIYVDSLAPLQKFRDELAAKEDAGCFRTTEGAHLLKAITEAFPLSPQIAVYLRFGAYSRTSFFDLTPEFILRLVSPTGGEPDLSFYAIARTPGDDRMRITLLSGAGKALTVPDTPAYFRYLYWTGASAHNFRATILGASDRKALAEATERFLADPDCTTHGEGAFCQSIAVTVGMNAGFYIRVNGQDVFLRIGGSIGEALGEAPNGMREMGRGRALPQSVTVRRMFHGRLIPVEVEGSANGIFSLVAMPGDEVTFD